MMLKRVKNNHPTTGTAAAGAAAAATAAVASSARTKLAAAATCRRNNHSNNTTTAPAPSSNNNNNNANRHHNGRRLLQHGGRNILLPTLLGLAILLLLLQTTVVHQSQFHYLRHLESSNPIQQAMQQQQNQRHTVASTRYNKTHLYPPEDPLPNPPIPVNGSRHFSACLLVMDDNPRLAEWLAYHAHVLPLQYLIVATDPRSQTSPTHFFNTWRQQGMVIEEWTDDDFWKRPATNVTTTTTTTTSATNNTTATNQNADPTEPFVALPPLKPLDEATADLQQKRDRHRGRQKYFYRHCLRRLQSLNRTWVTLHDSDEFLVYNHAGGDKFAAWQARQQAKQQQGQGTNARNNIEAERLHPSMVPPTTAEAGQLIHYLQHERAAGLKYYQSPCIGIPRLQFGTHATPIQETTKDVPRALHDLVPHLDTLTWRTHAARNDFIKNALGKVILDVSRLPPIPTLPFFMSLHRPIKTICPAPWNNEWSSGLRLNHYLGSWASYSFRDDSRRGYERSREQWEFKGQEASDGGSDDVIRPWISGFVQEHGPTKARELLADAGVPRHYKPPSANDPHWLLEPDKLAEILRTNETIANDNKRIAFDAFVRKRYRKISDEQQRDAARQAALQKKVQAAKAKTKPKQQLLLTKTTR